MKDFATLFNESKKYNSKQIFLQKKLDIVVPNYVIDSLWKVYNSEEFKNCSNSLSWNLNASLTNRVSMDNMLIVTDLMTHSNKKLLKDNTVLGMRKQERFKLRRFWEFINDDIKIIDNFLKQYFSSFFLFRIDKMTAGHKILYHANHFYPRIFIPMHNRNVVFYSKVDDFVISNNFTVGSCWLWDVRELHAVDNFDSEDRVIACFSIDPEIETNQEIFK
jgi:hypothetical protein